MDILVNVVNQKLKIATNLRSFVEGTQNFVHFVFNLPDEWLTLGYNKIFAQFIQNGTGYNTYLDENYSCYLPPEIVAGNCSLLLYGTAGSIRATTNAVVLTIDDNMLIQDAQSTEITQSLYDQLVDKVDTIININDSKYISYIMDGLQDLMQSYLDNGVLANMTIEDSSITRDKVNAAFESTLLKADTAMQPSIYDTHGYKRDIFDWVLEKMAEGSDLDIGAVRYNENDDYYLRFYDGDDNELEDLACYVPGGGGSGGGSSTSDSVIRIQNRTGASSFTVMDTSEVANIIFNVTSVDENQVATGDVTCYWYVGGVRKAMTVVSQGENTFNIFPYLTTGTKNTVRLTVEDSYGTTKSMTWNITVSSFSLTWNLDDMGIYDVADSLVVRLIPSGDGEKTVYVAVDGTTIETNVVTTSGRTLVVTIPAKAHGAHTITAWLEATVEDSTITSDTLSHVGLWVDSTASTPIVAVLPSAITAAQYSTVSIKYLVYDPSSESATAYLRENGTLKSSVSVGRTLQTWAYRVMNESTTTLTITCGNATATCTVTGTSSGVVINPVTAGLVLDVDPTGHSNAEAGYANFGYDDANGTRHPFTFSDNFDWTNGGFQLDDDGITAFVIKRGTTVTLDRSLFSDEAATNGKEIKLIFKSMNVLDYDAQFMNAKSGNVGLVLNAQIATLGSQASSVSVPYCEGKKIEMDINIHSKSDGLFATIWLEGVPSRAINYTSADSWQQTVPSNVVIGSTECDVWLYRMKMYNNSLSRFEILDNFIADCTDVDELVDRAERNDVYSNSGEIDMNKLAIANPNLRIIHITASRMTTSKEDSLTCNIEHILSSGGDTDNWSATGAKFKAQGTSSLQYGLSALNLDIDLSGASEWVDAENNTLTSYSMTNNSIPVDYFNLKANVASSENANNVVLADDYNTYCPVHAPGYSSDSRLRNTVEGHPCAVFFTNNGTSTISVGARSVEVGETILYFCGDMNNSKKNRSVFGQNTSAYPYQCCIEITNNNNDPCLFKDNISANETYDGDGDFEPRYPSTLSAEQIEAFETMHSWVVSTNRANADNSVLSAPVVYGTTTYTIDSEAYRLAKFKYEIENYFDLDSLLFHYLFTERHLMVDNRAKNTFVSFEPVDNGNASDISTYRWNFRCDYDNDTADGNDNSGGLTFTYGMEDTDMVGAQSISIFCHISIVEAQLILVCVMGTRTISYYNLKLIRNHILHLNIWVLLHHPIRLCFALMEHRKMVI